MWLWTLVTRGEDDNAAVVQQFIQVINVSELLSDDENIITWFNGMWKDLNHLRANALHSRAAWVDTR